MPVLRSLLKLYTSLDARKLAGFLDAGVDEEEVLSWMMVLKNAGRCIGRVSITGAGDEERASGSLLDGEWMSISDLNFVIDEVRVCNDAWCVADFRAEHDSHRRVDGRETLRGVVYPEFRVCGAGAGRAACVAIAGAVCCKGAKGRQECQG